MSHEKPIDLVYGLENLYDLMEEKGEEIITSDRPVCDGLKKITQQYEQDEKIAEGGMKRIYKVFDKRLNRYVALARLHENVPRAAHDSFIREARLTALLEHPGIISVYNIGIDESDSPFFTMELKVGKNLGQIVRDISEGSNKYTLNSLLESFIRVCDAVAYAHSKNVLHLDLKPENIQMGEFGEVKVCDWGLGKIVGSNDDAEFDQLLFNPDLLNNITLNGEIKGTPGYMAPEQINTDEDKSKHTDIFSLGCVLYYILCGKAPFQGNLQEVLRRTLKGDFLEPSLRSDLWLVPEGLNAVVLKAMRVNESERYQSVEKLRQEVHKYLSGRSTQAEKAGPFREAKLFLLRNKSLSLLTAVFIITFILGISFFTLKLSDKNKQLIKERDRAETNRIRAEKEKEIAQVALNRVKNDRDLVEALVDKRSVEVVRIYNFTDKMVFYSPKVYLKQAQNLLEKIEANDSEYAWATMQLGYVHFIRQEFSEAIKLFEISNNERELYSLALKYLEVQKVGNVLNVEDMKIFLSELLENKYRLADSLKILLYDSKIRNDLDEKVELIKFMLQYINPAWKNVSLNFDDQNKELKIHGKGFVRLAVENNQLHQTGPGPDRRVFFTECLNINSLDLSGTSFRYLSLLDGIKLKKLNISQTEVSDLSYLKNFTKLKTLIVSKNKFSKEQLADVPDFVEIILK